MTRTVPIAPVRKSIVVHADQARAFDVFINHIGQWWPKSHHIGDSPMKTVIIEPRKDGRWYHVSADGSEGETGTVMLWEPPSRVVLVWKLNANWERDPTLHTEVEVRFTPEGAGGTRVDLEHRLLENMGEQAGKVRDSIDAPNGWGGLLALFRDHAESTANAAKLG